MTWEIALGIFALIGGIISLAKPVMDLNNSITALTVKVNEFTERLEEQIEKSSEGRKRLWDHNGLQDKMLQDHETRIHDLETKEKEK